MPIKTKNIYQPASAEDGYRLLVMRRWPRGVPRGAVDGWDKDLGPSPYLLERWRQGKLDWESFRREYEAEMRSQGEKLRALATRARQETITLLCGCQDEERCHRTELKRLIEALAK